MNAEKQHFSPRQVAEGLGVSESTLKRWVDAGRLPAHRTAGGHRRIALADLLRFVRQGEAELLHPEVFGLRGLTGMAALTSDDDGDPMSRALEVLGALGLALDAIAEGITVADMRREGQPLVFANRAFYDMTGYSAQETLGRNCRFLQGPDTDPEVVHTMRRAIDAGEAVSVELLNYRKDGTPFWNRLSLVPVGGEDGEPEHYVGVQRDVTALREAGVRLNGHHHAEADPDPVPSASS